MLHKRSFFFSCSLIYLYVGLLLTHIFEFPEILKTLFSLPSFIVMPLLVGICFIESIKIIKKTSMLELRGACYFALCFFFGSGLISIFAGVLQLLNLSFMIQNIGYFILASVTLFFIVFYYFGKNDLLSSELSISLTRWWKQLFLIFTIASALLIYKCTIITIPLTAWSSWANPLAQVQAVLRILNQGFFDITQRWLEIILSSISCRLFNITSPEFFAYFATIIVTVMLAVGTFALAKYFINKTSIAVLCAIFSMFLNSPLGYHEVVTYHFKSNTLLISLLPWAILLTINLFNKIQFQKFRNKITPIFPSALFFGSLFVLSSSLGYQFFVENGVSYETQLTILRPLLLILIPASFFLISFLIKEVPALTISSVILFFNVVLYMTNESEFIIYFIAFELFVLLYCILSRNSIGVGYFLKLTGLILSIVILLTWLNVINLSDLNLSSLLGYTQYSINSFDQKKIMLSDGNALTTLYLFGLGISILIFSRSKKDSLLLGLIIIFFGIFFFPEYWSIRMLGMTIPFMALAISKVFESIFSLNYSLPWKKKKIRLFSSIAIITLIFIVLIPGLVSPIHNKLTSFPPSRLANYEYETAVWLRENTEETDIILSDYWTMMLLTPLSNKIWFTDRFFTSDSLDIIYKEILSELKMNVFLSSNSETAYHSLLNLSLTIQKNIDWTEKYYLTTKNIKQEDLTFLMILSSRTVEWLKDSNLDVDTPQYLPIDSIYFVPFNDSQKFEEVFSISQHIYVFKVVM